MVRTRRRRGPGLARLRVSCRDGRGLMGPIAGLACLLSSIPVAAQLPIEPVRSPAPFDGAIVRYAAGPVRCGAEEPVPIVTEEPFPRAFRTEAARERAWESVLRFSIDAAGRSHAIAVAASGPAGADERDLPAALAAWRFAPGAPRRGCEVRFTGRAVPVRQADAATLQRYLIYRRVAAAELFSVNAQADARLRPSGTACADGGLAGKRTIAYPDWDAVAPAPGAFAYSYLTGDVNAAGEPENVRLAGSSGGAELERQSEAAVLRSRYPAAARRGCAFYYIGWAVKPLIAPPPPRLRAMAPRDARCSRPRSRWAVPPDPSAPAAFEARNIQGWAILRYDISREGRAAGAEIVAAEPASAFGDAAVAALRDARAAPSAAGSRGCVQLFRFE